MEFKSEKIKKEDKLHLNVVKKSTSLPHFDKKKLLFSVKQEVKVEPFEEKLENDIKKPKENNEKKLVDTNDTMSQIEKFRKALEMCGIIKGSNRFGTKDGSNKQTRSKEVLDPEGRVTVCVGNKNIYMPKG